MFKDKKFFQKSFGIFLLTFIIVFSALLKIFNVDNFYDFAEAYKILSINFVSILAGIVILGYQLTLIRLIQEQKDNIVLPVLNYKKNFLLGLKYSAALWLIFIIFTYFVAATGFLYGLSVITVSFEIYFAVFVFAVIVMLGFYILFVPGFSSMFADKNEWLTFYKFKEFFNLFKSGKLHYVLSALSVAFIYVCNSLIMHGAYCVWKMIPSTLLFFLFSLLLAVINTYIIVFVIGYIVAKCFKNQD